MITNWLVTGDKHGEFHKLLSSLDDMHLDKKNTGIIILGDAGINFYLNNKDRKLKYTLEQSGYNFYLLRGNHEQNPRYVEGLTYCYDYRVKQKVYADDEYHDIKYLDDGLVYQFGLFNALCIGGAYSVDKYFRLQTAGLTEQAPENELIKKAGWFPKEQVDACKMRAISSHLPQKVDFILTHTGPLAFEPTDLFIGYVNQNQVDKTMEKWLDWIRQEVDWGVWLFGHYHCDRIERPRVEQYYHNIESLEVIWNRWFGQRTINEEWWLPKSQNYYFK